MARRAQVAAAGERVEAGAHHREDGAPFGAEAPPAPERRYDSKDSGARQWRDVWAAGQGVGSIRAIQPLSEVVDQIEHEYRQASERFLQRQPRSPS